MSTDIQVRIPVTYNRDWSEQSSYEFQVSAQWDYNAHINGAVNDSVTTVIAGPDIYGSFSISYPNGTYSCNGLHTLLTMG